MIRVFIVDDHPLVVEGIRSLLLHQKDIEVVGSAMNARACLDSLMHKTADVVLMDISLPDMSGIELCALLKSKYPAIMVLALTSFHEGSYVKKMIGSGANGYLFKDADGSELLEAIQQVDKGKSYLSFDAGKALHQDAGATGLPVLTRREKEVLELIAEGYTNPQIANKLFISLSTVDSHRKNLHGKLRVKNTAMLIRFAIEHQLI